MKKNSIVCHRQKTKTLSTQYFKASYTSSYKRDREKFQLIAFARYTMKKSKKIIEKIIKLERNLKTKAAVHVLFGRKKTSSSFGPYDAKHKIKLRWSKKENIYMEIKLLIIRESIEKV